jgi:hypothetical protein
VLLPEFGSLSLQEARATVIIADAESILKNFFSI